ncbi:MAG: YheC/YheD family protein [Firmicutes bacterium]|nr:YheC/YheD family protein [Bacillota bacterium]
MVFCFSPAGINWSKETISGLYFVNEEWKRAVFPFPDAVYNRLYNKKQTGAMKSLERSIGWQKIFNKVTHLDKWQINNALSSNSLQAKLPGTQLYNKENLFDMLDHYHHIIIKPRYGCFGRNIYCIESNNDKFFIYRQTTTANLVFTDQGELLNKLDSLMQGKKYIIQQKIKLAEIDGRLFDIRVLVQKNKHGNWVVTGKLSRIAVKNFYITNVCQEIRPVTETLQESGQFTPELIAAVDASSIEAAKLLDKKLGHLGEIGIDFCIDYRNKLWLLEVNGKPMKNLFEQLDNQRLIKTVYFRPLEYAAFLAQK